MILFEALSEAHFHFLLYLDRNLEKEYIHIALYTYIDVRSEVGRHRDRNTKAAAWQPE